MRPKVGGAVSLLMAEHSTNASSSLTTTTTATTTAAPSALLSTEELLVVPSAASRTEPVVALDRPRLLVGMQNEIPPPHRIPGHGERGTPSFAAESGYDARRYPPTRMDSIPYQYAGGFGVPPGQEITSTPMAALGASVLPHSSTSGFEYAPYSGYQQYQCQQTDVSPMAREVSPQQLMQQNEALAQRQAYSGGSPLSMLANSTIASEMPTQRSHQGPGANKYPSFHPNMGYPTHPMMYDTTPQVVDRSADYVTMRFNPSQNNIALGSHHTHESVNAFRPPSLVTSYDPEFDATRTVSYDARYPYRMAYPSARSPTDPVVADIRSHRFGDFAQSTTPVNTFVDVPDAMKPECEPRHDGLNQNQLYNTPPVHFDPVDGSHQVGRVHREAESGQRDQSMCQVCLNPRSDQYLQPCGHLFHQACISALSERLPCPVCGQIVSGIVSFLTPNNRSPEVHVSNDLGGEPMQAPLVNVIPVVSAKFDGVASEEASGNRPPPIETQSASASGTQTSRPSSTTSSNGSTKPKKSKRLKDCSVPGCDRTVRSRGLCKGHGGGRRCGYPGCGLSDQGGGFCISHGGGKRCQRDGCENSAQSRGLCKLHGGGSRCTVKNCTKSSQGRGLCRAHGGGRRCMVEGCNKTDRRAGYCVTHGADKKCIVPECSKTGRIDNLCTKHYFERNQVALQGADTSQTSASTQPTQPTQVGGPEATVGQGVESLHDTTVFGMAPGRVAEEQKNQ